MEIPDDDVPQGELPEQPGDPGTQPENPGETVIDEEEPPLADAPETGDSLPLWITAAALLRPGSGRTGHHRPQA